MVIITQNEVSIIKNAVLDCTEAYVDARLETLNFVKTMIGTVVAEPIKNNKGKYEHKVKCNVTSGRTDGIEYTKVLSVGNTPFPKGSVVFIVAPNAQFSNMFILGKLDDTPCNITAGSIMLGGSTPETAKIYLTGKATADGSYGHIAGFNIREKELIVGDAILSPDVMGCGVAGKGMSMLVGDIGANSYGYVQLSNSGNTEICLDGIRINGRGQIDYYDSNGGHVYEDDQDPKPKIRYLANIPIKTIYEDDAGYLHWS